MATFNVINSNDSGIGSLRWAIAQANDNAGLDTIEFDVELVNLDSAIDITDSVEINGDDATLIQNGEDLILNIDDGTDSLIDVNLSQLKFEGGRPVELGGAIYSLENLTVDETVFRDNVTTSSGGAIYSDSGDLTITNRM